MHSVLKCAIFAAGDFFVEGEWQQYVQREGSKRLGDAWGQNDECEGESGGGEWSADAALKIYFV